MVDYRVMDNHVKELINNICRKYSFDIPLLDEEYEAMITRFQNIGILDRNRCYDQSQEKQNNNTTDNTTVIQNRKK